MLQNFKICTNNTYSKWLKSQLLCALVFRHKGCIVKRINETVKKLNQADARYESLKSVFIALEREKADLHNHVNLLDEQLGERQTQIFELKGQIDVKES